MSTAAQALEARQTVEEVMRLADAVADAGSQMLPAVEIARRLATLRAALESTAAELEALRKDAERYRLVRRGQHWSVINGIGDVLRAEGLDAAVDAALTQGGK